MNRETLELELLYNSLVNLGSYYPLEASIDFERYESEIAPFENDWKQYNPRKPHIPRQGLSLTSLDGGLSGRPDLDSLYEYNVEHGTQYEEHSFRTPTKVLEVATAFNEPLKDFIPHLGRSHLIRLNDGGYFPFHRDSQRMGAKTFRLIAQLRNCDVGQFCFLYGMERIRLEPGHLYFLNTKVEHAVFSFGPKATLLVLNVLLSPQSVEAVCKNLMAR